MKGGITSGIQCPPLVLELAHKYRFRSVGGTSAGAVAAAVAAAAEYGREHGGFEKLGALNDWLAVDPHLLDLFQPTRATRPLLELPLAFERRRRRQPARSGVAGMMTRIESRLPGWVRMWFVVIPGALRDAMPVRFWIATALGGVLGGALDVLIARGLVDPGHPLARTVVAIILPVMFIGSFLASLGACAWRLWRLMSVEVPAQGFGICTGLTPVPVSPQPALTDWLHERIQDLAGLPVAGPPLTVGTLSGKRLASIETGIGIELRMITTSPNLGRSIVLPVEHEQFLFREDEMRGLFPGPIVDHMVATASRTDSADSDLTDYFALPRPEDMPVLVLVRMSLSFPILLSAVPLYVLGPGGSPSQKNQTAERPGPATVLEPSGDRAQRVWFRGDDRASDFAVRSFDGRLPLRPTFGVNLSGGADSQTTPLAGSVFLPAVWRPFNPAISDIVSLREFLGATQVEVQ